MTILADTEVRQSGLTVVKAMLPPPHYLLRGAQPLSPNFRAGNSSFETTQYSDYRYFIDEPKIPMIINDQSGGGLGDKIIDLRQAVAFARHFPDRKFSKWTTLIEIAPTTYLDLPPNLNRVNPPGPVHRLNIRPRDRIEFPDADLPPNDKAPFNNYDFNVMFRIGRYGAVVDPVLFYQSIFTITPEQLTTHPITSDILIVPDAKELNTVDKNRSIKSISADKWATVFSKLDPTVQVAIIIGTAHPQYCQAVVEVAHQSGLQNVQAVAGSLSDVINAILSTRRFVGMDSGTTHLAAEVIKAARQAGRTIDFREIYNDNTYNFYDFGIADPEGLFKTLVYKTKEFGDLDSIDSNDVVIFIQT